MTQREETITINLYEKMFELSQTPEMIYQIHSTTSSFRLRVAPLRAPVSLSDALGRVLLRDEHRDGDEARTLADGVRAVWLGAGRPSQAPAGGGAQNPSRSLQNRRRVLCSLCTSAPRPISFQLAKTGISIGLLSKPSGRMQVFTKLSINGSPYCYCYYDNSNELFIN